MITQQKVSEIINDLEKDFKEKEEERKGSLYAYWIYAILAIAAVIIISKVFKENMPGYLPGILPYILSLIIWMYFLFLYIQLPKKTFQPLRVRDYLNQKITFKNALTSVEPYILVLRSFEHIPFMKEHEVDDESIRKYWVKEHEYEAFNEVETLDGLLDFPLKAVYVGKTRSCCSKTILKRSLFLISDDHWVETVEELVEKSLFIILIPGKSNGLLQELKHVSKMHLGKVYVFLPLVPGPNNNRLDNWVKTYETFKKEGLHLPYDYDIDTNSFYKIEGNQMTQINLKEAYEKHKSIQSPLSETLHQLLKKEYINFDYKKECSKYFSIKSYLKKHKIEKIFDDV